MEDNKNLIEKGLTTVEAKRRLEQFGENAVFKKKKIGPFLIFLSKLKNPLFVLMIAISFVSFLLGATSSAIIVVAMVLLSATLDFLNTYKSQQNVEKLVSRVATKVTVVRDGKKQEIDFKNVVVGDVIFLSAGNVVPADCQVIDSDDFFVNQSSLSGESLPAEKVAGEIDPLSHSSSEASQKLSPENPNMVFMGTSVVSGFATVLVIQAGAETQFGKIAQALSGDEPKTDFEKSMMGFGIFVTKVIFCMVCFVLAVYIVKNFSHLNQNVIVEAITFALAITIGVTPDMLPAIITVCLSKGSQMMAKKDVIVKHLASIENFGSLDILCTDKTGTLTKDKIALVKYMDYEGKESKEVLQLGTLSSRFHTGVQNPLDGAINEFKGVDISDWKKVDEIPYDFMRKRSSMVVEKDGRRILICKGAPEEIIKISKSYKFDDTVSEDKAQAGLVQKKFDDLSAEGFRVLAVCFKEVPADNAKVYEKEWESEMIFAGFLAFLDPPKEDVRKTLDEIEGLGIDVKILTGDNDLLAQKICRDIGLKITGVVTGGEIAKMTDDELRDAALKANIFARIDPAQKERIILVLKKAGKSVGYLGDGINDAPALKAADVGISVNNAVDIAKDTADIILLQKSLESLKDGIIEGRKTFHNTLKYALMGLSSNFGNMFSMMGAVTFLPFLPMLPSQILFNNFVYDASQFSLPTDSVDEDELLRPAHWDLKFIRRYMIVFGLVSSIFDFLTFYLLFFVYHLPEHQFQTGWLIESFATQTLVIYVIRTKKIPFLQSRPSKPLFITTFAAVLFVWLVQFTFLGKLLQLERLPFGIMAIIAGYVVIYLVLVEVVKRFFYHRQLKRMKEEREKLKAEKIPA
jgi:Mg2+-importing ATPase